MKKRVGAIEEFTFLPLTEGRQLHITIAITGWLASGRYRENLDGVGGGQGRWWHWLWVPLPCVPLGHGREKLHFSKED